LRKLQRENKRWKYACSACKADIDWQAVVVHEVFLQEFLNGMVGK
jgi:hypothetical protein